MTITNGFATKKDLKALKQYVDKRFNGVDKQFVSVDKRFNSVDKRFNSVDKRFDLMDKKFEWFRSEIKDDFKIWSKDTFREFEHRWQQFVDPFLKEIETSREDRALMMHQYDRTQKLLQKVARKVGVEENN